MSSQIELQLNAVGNFTLGVSADVFAVCATQPIDVAKTHVQKGLWSELKSQLRCSKGIGPVCILWKGAPINCIGAIPQGGAPFLINALAKKHLFQSEELSDSQRIMSGMMTGALSSLVIAPFDRICKEQQVNGGTALSSCIKIVKRDGVGSLFKAVKLIAARDSMVFGAFFGVREILNVRLQNHIPHKETRMLAASSIACGIAGVLTTPIDRANTLIQTDQKKSYSKVFDIFRKIIAQEGVKGLGKGALLRGLFGAVYYAALGVAPGEIASYLPEAFRKGEAF